MHHGTKLHPYKRSLHHCNRSSFVSQWTLYHKFLNTICTVVLLMKLEEHSESPDRHRYLHNQFEVWHKDFRTLLNIKKTKNLKPVTGLITRLLVGFTPKIFTFLERSGKTMEINLSWDLIDAWTKRSFAIILQISICEHVNDLHAWLKQ